MDRHSFTIEISGGPTQYRQYENDLHKVGCSDGMIGMVDNKIFIDFDRYANSYNNAVASAVHALKGLGAEILKINPILD